MNQYGKSSAMGFIFNITTSLPNYSSINCWFPWARCSINFSQSCIINLMFALDLSLAQSMLFWLKLFLLLFVVNDLTYLLERQKQREAHRERGVGTGRISYPLVHSWNSHKDWSWARLNSGARSCIWSYVWASNISDGPKYLGFLLLSKAH